MTLSHILVLAACSICLMGLIERILGPYWFIVSLSLGLINFLGPDWFIGSKCLLGLIERILGPDWFIVNLSMGLIVIVPSLSG